MEDYEEKQILKLILGQCSGLCTYRPSEAAETTGYIVVPVMAIALPDVDEGTKIKMFGNYSAETAQVIEKCVFVCQTKFGCSMWNNKKIAIQVDNDFVKLTGPSWGASSYVAIRSALSSTIPKITHAATGAIDIFGHISKIGSSEMKMKAMKAGLGVVMPRDNIQRVDEIKSRLPELRTLEVLFVTDVNELISLYF